MTPEEYAARELNVSQRGNEEPLYAPGSNPSEIDPNVLLVMNGGAPTPATSPNEAEKIAMALEYNYTLPLERSRAEVANEKAKHEHLVARTNFWNALSLAVLLVPILSFIAVLVK